MRILRASVFCVFILFAVSGFAANGKTLYKKCVACHGTDGTKSALGVGHPLKGQKEEALYKKMKGYLDGSYGGKKKAIMKRNLAKYSDDELKALAAFIATL